MDEFNLSRADKDLLCAVIMAESGFKPSAVNRNRSESGKVLSTDWGLCQINDHYHIGPGKSFETVEQVVSKPELSVRFMVKQYRAGNLNWWIAYKNGSYRKYLPTA